MKAGNYEFKGIHGSLSAAGMAAGIVYGLITRKGLGGILLFAVAGSMIGFGAATLIKRPTRIK